MKILYVTNYEKISNISGGFLNDYLNDLLFFGLTEILGENVIDSTPILPLYQECKDKIHKSRFWGGMTAFWLLEKDIADRSNIREKIKHQFYDYIIYGSIKRCRDYYDLVEKCYPNEKVILVDGDDDTKIDPLRQKHKYFKRELLNETENVFPISFSFPTFKMANPVKIKQRYLATCVPGKPETYIFEDEVEYYKDYQSSFFGITKKKAGWDCMRHYEILGNYCVPYFEDIESCPKECLHNFPKELLLEANKLRKNFDTGKYFDILDELYIYTANNLTTKHVAQKFLEKIVL